MPPCGQTCWYVAIPGRFPNCDISRRDFPDVAFTKRCNSHAPSVPIIDEGVQNARGVRRRSVSQIQSGASSNTDSAVKRPCRTVAVKE